MTVRQARKYYPGMGPGLAEPKWLDNEDLEFGADADATLSWDGTNLNILPLTLDTGRVNIGDGTLLMDLRVFGSAAGNYAEFDASEDQLNVVVTKAITGADFGISVAYIPTLGGGDSVVGVNVTVAPTDSGGVGTWASAFFGSVNLAVDGVGGYVSGAEFEIIASGAFNTCDYAVLVLNTNDTNVGVVNNRAFIWLNDYGTREIDNLFDFRSHAIAGPADDILISDMSPTPFNTAIRCRIAGAVPIWLYGSTVGPAAIEDFQWISTAGVGNYMEYDASEERMNLVIGAKVPAGNEIALSLDITSTFDGGDSMVGLNVVMRPQDSVGLGTWLAGIYSAVVMGTDGVNGYFCAAELEVVLTGAAAVSEYAVLVLNVNDSQTGGPNWRSFILLHDYGTRDMNLFLDIRDLAIGGNSAVDMVTTSGNQAQDHAIRIRLPNGTIAWIMVTQTAP